MLLRQRHKLCGRVAPHILQLSLVSIWSWWESQTRRWTVEERFVGPGAGWRRVRQLICVTGENCCQKQNECTAGHAPDVSRRPPDLLPSPDAAVQGHNLADAPRTVDTLVLGMNNCTKDSLLARRLAECRSLLHPSEKSFFGQTRRKCFRRCSFSVIARLAWLRNKAKSQIQRKHVGDHYIFASHWSMRLEKRLLFLW